MNINLTDRINQATQHRDSDFFCDSRVADNMNNINNMNGIETIETKLRLNNCHLTEALDGLSPSASLTSPSETSLGSFEESGSSPVKGSGSEAGPAQTNGDMQVDPDLPVKMLKADLIDENKLTVTLNLTNLKGTNVVLKAGMNTQRKHWKRGKDKDGNRFEDTHKEHCKLVDEFAKQMEKDPFWDTVRVSKFLKYDKAFKHPTRNTTFGISGVLCYESQAKIAILHVFIKQYHAVIELDKDLTAKQIKTGYMCSGMLVKKSFTKYNAIDVNDILEM